MKNASVTITKNDISNFLEPGYDDTQDLRFENVTNLSVGGKLIWIEYLEDDELRYRAYGRYEFANVIVQTDDEFSVFPVGCKDFKELRVLFE